MSWSYDLARATVSAVRKRGHEVDVADVMEAVNAAIEECAQQAERLAVPGAARLAAAVRLLKEPGS